MHERSFAFNIAFEPPKRFFGLPIKATQNSPQMPHYQLRKRHLAIAATTLCISGFPRPALANNGLKALEGVFEFLLFVCGTALGSLIFTIINYFTRSRWIAILSSVLLLPLAVVSVIAVFALPQCGVPAALVVLFWCFAIAESARAKRP